MTEQPPPESTQVAPPANIPRRPNRLLAAIALILFVTAAVLLAFWFLRGRDTAELSINQLRQCVVQGKIQQLVIDGPQITGTFTSPVEIGGNQARRFRTQLPARADAKLVKWVRDNAGKAEIIVRNADAP